MEAVITKHPGNVSIQTHSAQGGLEQCHGRLGVEVRVGVEGGEMNNWGFQMLNELWPGEEVLTDVRDSNDASHHCRF